MWHAKSIEEISWKKEGLLLEEVSYLQKQCGHNVLKEKPQRGLWAIFLAQCANPLLFVLLAAALLKIALGSYLEGVVIFITILFMVFVGWLQEAKAERSMELLKKLSPPTARVRRENRAQTVDAAELVPGDLIFLEAGVKVPADMRLVEVYDLQIDESCLTGEALAVKKQIDALSKDTSLAEQTNMAFSGTVVVQGRGLGRVTAIGMETALGKVAATMQRIQQGATPLQKSIRRLTHAMMAIVCVCSLIFSGVGILFGLSWVEIALLSISMAVAAIPEGLPATVTVVLAVGVLRVAKKQGLIRKLIAVETLGSTNIICTDKTGTLTKNAMLWTDFSIGLEKSLPVDVALPHTSFAHEKLWEIASFCHTVERSSQNEQCKYVGDPTEIALVEVLDQLFSSWQEEQPAKERIFEIPFDSKKRYMAVTYSLKGREEVFLKGSPETVLSFCTHYFDREQIRLLDAESKKQILAQEQALGQKGKRVLAGAWKAAAPRHWTEEECTQRAVFTGLYGLCDPIREGVHSALSAAEKAGVRVLMVTGDSAFTAQAIGRELGLQADRVIEGKEVSHLTPDALVKRIEQTAICARIEPLHKLKIVDSLQRAGCVVAMTGDGVNDALALEKADIGVAMGKNGTDIAKDAADIILTDDHFATIVSCIEEGRSIFLRMRSATAFLLITCFGEIATIFLVFFLSQQSPLEALQILWINLITGSLIAVPIGVEKKRGEELNHPPRESQVGLIYPGMMFRVFVLAAILSGSASLIFFAYRENLTHARTMTFVSIVLFEWFLSLHMRSDTQTLRSLGLLSHPLLLGMGTVALALLALILYVPGLQWSFHTEPLSIRNWFVCLLPGALVILFESLRKRSVPHLFSYGKWRAKNW
ncbi:MAG: HAD-IC family P-type ATPase [Chlamydiota bacterium]